ncbi:MAG: polyhydroxyalkanoate synthesis repressor PhaR [Alphaproteobacteria bacterium]
MPKSDTATVIIKKYANRRLYNTATSKYVKLDDLATMVREGIDFSVHDAKSGEDLTRSVLTQIIVEEEAKGENLLPINFLRQLIGMYGSQTNWMVPQYLEWSMKQFSENQDAMQKHVSQTMGGMFPFSGQLQEMGKHNMQMFENAMRMFNPLGGGGASADPGDAEATANPGDPLNALQSQLNMLQRQMAIMQGRDPDKED